MQYLNMTHYSYLQVTLRLVTFYFDILYPISYFCYLQVMVLVITSPCVLVHFHCLIIYCCYLQVMVQVVTSPCAPWGPTLTEWVTGMSVTVTPVPRATTVPLQE